jgi:hypothetical protein
MPGSSRISGQWQKETQVDHSRFDDVVKSWGCGTRRGLLRLMAGTAAGALVVGQLGIEDVAAKCVNPGKKCKGKDGKKEKCCGGAKCQGGRCRCKNGGTSCGKLCCQPGQVCQDGAPDVCVNGPLEPGDVCDPDKPLGCESGLCRCTEVIDVGTVCTCRQEGCFGFGTDCANTSQCCQGFCSGFDPEVCTPNP